MCSQNRIKQTFEINFDKFDIHLALKGFMHFPDIETSTPKRYRLYFGRHNHKDIFFLKRKEVSFCQNDASDSITAPVDDMLWTYDIRRRQIYFSSKTNNSMFCFSADSTVLFYEALQFIKSKVR